MLINEQVLLGGKKTEDLLRFFEVQADGSLLMIILFVNKVPDMSNQSGRQKIFYLHTLL